MTIPPELEAQILRYYHVEKWRIGTIARQLHVHHGTVMRVLAQAGLPRTGPPARRSQIDPYLPFMRRDAARSSRRSPPAASTPWCASAATAAARITSGILSPVIGRARPAEAYLRLRTLAGRAGTSGLGTLRASRDRSRPPAVDGVRHGAELLAPDLPALLPRRAPGELPARACRGLRGLARLSPGAPVRQSQERRAGACRATPSASTRRCSHSPRTIATSPAQWRWRAATRKAESSAPCATSATASSRPASSLMWTISMPRLLPGAPAPRRTGLAPSSKR